MSSDRFQWRRCVGLGSYGAGQRRSGRPNRGVCALAAVLVACQGAIGGSPEAEAGGEAPVAPEPPENDASSAVAGADPSRPLPTAEATLAPDPHIVDHCSPSTARGQSRQSVRKLTKRELVQSMKDVLAPHPYTQLQALQASAPLRAADFSARNRLQAAANDFPADFASVPGEDFEQTFNAQQLLAWSQLVHEVATVFAGAGWGSVYVEDDCLQGARPAETCYREFATAFGRHALRRPLSADEVQTFAGLGRPAENGAQGVYRIVSGLFLSPHFMYQLEDAGTPDESRVRVTQHEIARRLSYALAGSVPDDALVRAADEGRLSSLEAIRTQAQRLVRTDRARATWMAFFEHWVGLDEVPRPLGEWKETQGLPGRVDLIPDVAREEAQRFIEHVIWETEGTYEDLLTAPWAVPFKAPLDAIYETGGLSEQAVPASNHPGLFTRAALLLDSELQPNTIQRAVRIKVAALCQDVPSPDFTIVAARQENLDELDPAQTPHHEIVTHLTSAPECVTCHESINPFGFLFEAYSPAAVRSEVQYWVERVNSGGQRFGFAAEFPLPGPQELMIEEGESEVFDTPDALLRAIGGSEQGARCFAVRAFRHLQRRSETEQDACGIADGLQAVKDRPILDAFVDLLVNEDIFWRKP